MNQVHTHQYATQCDRLQRADQGSPNRWLSIMVNAQRISRSDFESRCDTTDLLDEGETLSDFCASDPCAGFYMAACEGMPPVFFVQQSGFEFFFTHDGQLPCLMPLSPEQCKEHDVSVSDPMAKTLFRANDPRIAGAYGWESDEGYAAPDLRHIRGLDVNGSELDRFVLELEGKPVSGICVKDNIIHEVFTHPDHRRQGLASQVLEMAESLLGPIEHSDSLTGDGRLFAQSPAKPRARGVNMR